MSLKSRPQMELESYSSLFTTQYDQPAAYGDLALLGITESELDQQCDELFYDTPIKFIPRKNNKIDLKINLIIKQMDITIPVEFIKGDLYLIGSDRLNMKFNENNDSILVRVGGGYTKFDEHIEKY